ncbi:hypothetical protein E2C01_096982 [Portunus trituberculatus]|uniref:Uncharacterized protein n=1 Tax=Portunus trituberculatus TaxID=210409 RepID=A0A5B7K9X7_PORTR|nr:hypothetical protein [Portunus trituberculatus]
MWVGGYIKAGIEQEAHFCRYIIFPVDQHSQIPQHVNLSYNIASHYVCVVDYIWLGRVREEEEEEEEEEGDAEEKK